MKLMKKQTIVKTIRNIYFAKLIPAVLFIVFTIFVFTQYPFMDILFPKQLTDNHLLSSAYNSEQEYLKINIPILYYTGYDYIQNSEKKGSYYYTFINDKCVFFLLDNKTADGALELKNITFKAKLITDSKQFSYLSEHFSSDLSWTDSELSKISEQFIVSELDAAKPLAYVILTLMGAVDIFSFVLVFLSLLFILFPHLSPICKHLGKGKVAKSALKEVDLQLENNRYFYVSDMSITSSYFIELDKYHAEIIPLNNIIWAYKHSRMNKLWGISYTLVIYSKHNISRFHHKQQYDIDFILEYLAESSPNIIIGNSKENRILAMERFRK